MLNNADKIVYATTEQLSEALRQQRCGDHDEPGVEQCHLCVDLTAAADRLEELESAARKSGGITAFETRIQKKYTSCTD